jgi:hypothetical protein
MTIEYICTNIGCGHTFLDVVVIPFCKCPKCNEEMEPVEWEGLPEG